MNNREDMNDSRWGEMFDAAKGPRSLLNVQGVDLGVTTEEIVGFVREGRSRYGE